ncbi:Transcriptional regulator SOH1 [Pseudoloma neurophilia]|uniref:Mediator of RNA polymerase II transcription subunit 31 n=1 Tax=Pseudoloma neurophilia TaxID=146866 RepID=A0A0R0M4L1_9MICR|nr:Transcriptional regulator SOH1 [Pseudoloma neurophilia]
MPTKFEKELEFVQLLTNPHYLHFLAKNDYFKNADFRDYLKYLEYWNDKPYVHFLIYPQCLVILKAINTNEEFVQKLNDPKNIEFLENQLTEYWMWKNFNNSRETQQEEK